MERITQGCPRMWWVQYNMWQMWSCVNCMNFRSSRIQMRCSNCSSYLCCKYCLFVCLCEYLVDFCFLLICFVLFCLLVCLRGVSYLLFRTFKVQHDPSLYHSNTIYIQYTPTQIPNTPSQIELHPPK